MTPSEEFVFITGIAVENIGGIEKFDTLEFLQEDLGAVVMIEGANESGKTSLLDSVENVLAGGHDPAMIRRMDLDGDGVMETPCEFGRITLRLSNGTVAVKTITLKDSTLVIKTKDGGVVNSPASYLKSLAPAGSFDPVGFLKAAPKDKQDFLLKTISLSFTPVEINTALDEQVIDTKCAKCLARWESHKESACPKGNGFYQPVESVTLQRLNELRQGRYDSRTQLNTTVRDMKGIIRSMEDSLPTSKGVDWASKRDELQEKLTSIETDMGKIEAEIGQETAERKADKRKDLEAVEIVAKDLILERLKDIEFSDEQLDRDFDDVMLAMVRSLKFDSESREKVLASFDANLDCIAFNFLKERTADLQKQRAIVTEELGEAKAKADEDTKASGVRESIRAQREKLSGHIAEEARLTAAIKRLDALKSDRLKTLPIENLDITKDSKDRPIIMIGGLPLHRLNRAQELAVAIQISCLASGSMRLTICEAAEFDSNTMAEVAEAYKKANRQLIVARWKDNEPLKVTNVFPLVAA